MMRVNIGVTMFYLIVLCMCDVMTHIIDFSVVWILPLQYSSGPISISQSEGWIPSRVLEKSIDTPVECTD